MLTGVSRFSRTNIFSGINNLNDITFDDRYASICGFTQEEIRDDLWQGVESLGTLNGWTTEKTLGKLKEEYDGYHFSERCPDIYNPFSLLLALEKNKIKPYWIETVTPTFLVEKLKSSSLSFARIFNDNVPQDKLSEADTAFTSPVSLLFQMGYLTIKGYDALSERYSLGVPNKEVEESLFPYLLSNFSGQDRLAASDWTKEVSGFLCQGDLEKFLIHLKSFIGSIPYDIMGAINEKYFQHLMFLVFRTAGLDVEAEKKTSFGRSDLIVKTKDYIYIFELKLDSSPQEAIKQIEEMEYRLPYLNDNRKVLEIGINFSSGKRNIDDWIVKE